MKFKLEIDCGNAAFGETPEDRAAEISRILREAILCVDAEMRPGDQYPLHDDNGNTVGRCRMEGED